MPAYDQALGELAAVLLGATGNVFAVALDYEEQSHRVAHRVAMKA